MNDLLAFTSICFGSAIAIYWIWWTCHYNGKILIYWLRRLLAGIVQRQALDNSASLPSPLSGRLSMAGICLVGAMPLALLSISVSVLNYCINSVYSVGVLEAVLTVGFLLMPRSAKREFDVFGVQAIKNNRMPVAFVGVWCFIFAVWAIVNNPDNLDYMISNTNPDMWAYVRRFSAFSTSNLNFYGGLDSFKFKGSSACDYLLGSPKKFSSFLGSIFVYLSAGTSLGICIFQGMLGGLLTLCLFKEWFETSLAESARSQSSKLSLGRGLLILWALFSPSVYWLLGSSYLSNTLFLIVVCLTLRETKRMAIDQTLHHLDSLVCFSAILVIVFAFYPAFIPLILLAYGAVALIYTPRSAWSLGSALQSMALYVLLAILWGVVFYLVFPSQLGLREVSKSLNPLESHAANFVPLNPWSLVQERPKPMGRAKDFGLYFNVMVGLICTGVMGCKVWQTYRIDKQPDFLAALVGLGLYGSYLLAFIPLTSTYRLMKIGISIIYPLAIFGLLPLLVWWSHALLQKPRWIRRGVLALAIVHIIFNIYKVFNYKPFPTGTFIIVNPDRLESVQSVAVVACQGVHNSQFYERLVGLRLASQYPHLQINVFRPSASLTEEIRGDLIIYGKTVPGTIPRKNTCHFSI
jgi:hypothetical protein